jgi:SAM-dependent methyltransferase
MRAAVRSIYAREQFNPSWLGLLLNPFFLARRGLYRAVRELAPRLTGRLLDVGCGTQPYRDLFPSAREYVGLDIDSDRTRRLGVADLLYDGSSFPLPDAQFDAVLCNQVLEHVFTPDTFIAEIARVLKPGGQLLLTAPFVWDEHEQPVDYARYSSFGLAHLLRRNGLEIVEQRKLLDNAGLLFQLANAYVYRLVQSWPAALRLFVGVGVMAPLTLLGLLVSVVLPRNPDLFLDQVVLARKP